MAGTRLETPDSEIESPDNWSPLRPTLRETIRTQICATGPKYLVDKLTVTVQKKSGKTAETFRLWLSDGEKCIQAILKAHAHPFVISGDIAEGSYVRLLDYELLQLPKVAENGSVWLFAISSLQIEGHDGREELDFELEEMNVPGSPKPNEVQPLSESAEKTADELEPELPDWEAHGQPEMKQLLPALSGLISAKDSPLATARKRKYSEKPVALSPLDPNVLTGSRDRRRKRVRNLGLKDVTPSKKALIDHTNELRESLLGIQSTPTKQRIRAATTTPSASPVKQAKSLQPYARNQTMPARATSPSSPPTQKPAPPVKITPLSELTGVKARRNVTIPHVLAIITHVNSRILTRKGFPDSREILIMDRSTSKQVHVTVFVNAAEFLPEPGTVALFSKLTTHEYNGGSLKAYAQKCAGTPWFVPATPGWQWEEEGEALQRYFADRPDAWILPERIWWTDRGYQKISQQI